MTGAYAGIRNGGTAVSPYGLLELRIRGDDQPLIGRPAAWASASSRKRRRAS